MQPNPKASISNAFERTFFSIPLELQIHHCDAYELTPLFKELLPTHQPILEAGSGSGRWVAWFINQGWRAVGLDWSEKLCEAARAQILGGRFEAGDMGAMPFREGEFGSIVALGSIEHSPEGPVKILREFRRVLKIGGIALITVPYNGPIRRFLNPTRIKWYVRLKQSPFMRSVFNKHPLVGKKLSEAKTGTKKSWSPVFSYSNQGWDFFEYRFTKSQMRDFIRQTNFEIIREFVEFHDEGILHNFGFLSGRYDFQKAQVTFSPFGKILKKLLPVSSVGHMLCYIIGKNES